MIEGLKACCNEFRPDPFRFEWGGATWVGATNNCAMAAVQTDDQEALAAATGNAIGDPEAYDVLAPTGEGVPVSLAALRAWCNEGPRVEPCTECGGTREWKCRTCKGTGKTEHDCDCDHCTVTDEEECPNCDGVRHFPCEECEDGTQEAVLPGVLAGVVVNRTLLAKALASAPQEGTVMLATRGDKCVNLFAPWWRAAVMAYRHSPEGVSVFHNESA